VSRPGGQRLCRLWREGRVDDETHLRHADAAVALLKPCENEIREPTAENRSTGQMPAQCQSQDGDRPVKGWDEHDVSASEGHQNEADVQSICGRGTRQRRSQVHRAETEAGDAPYE
jgi:hypothetical protein